MSKMRRERMAARLGTQLAQQPAANRPPPPTLRHRPSLRQPPRLLQHLDNTEAADLPVALRKNKREAALKGCKKAASVAVHGMGGSELDKESAGDAEALVMAKSKHQGETPIGGSSGLKRRLRTELTGPSCPGVSDGEYEGVDVAGRGEGHKRPKTLARQEFADESRHGSTRRGLDRYGIRYNSAGWSSRGNGRAKRDDASPPLEREWEWTRPKKAIDVAQESKEIVDPEHFVDLRSLDSRPLGASSEHVQAPDEEGHCSQQRLQGVRTSGAVLSKDFGTRVS